MNSNLKEVINFLVSNIVKSKLDVPDNIQNRLNLDIKSNEVKSLFRITHYKFHKNILVFTKACKEKHCLECLIESFFCDHGKVIKTDEKALFSYIAKNPEKLSNSVNIKRHCLSCNTMVFGSHFSKKTCFCECYYCVLSYYKQYYSACINCGCYYDNNDILQISKFLNQSINIYCHLCFKTIDPNSVNGNFCENCKYNNFSGPFNFF